MKASKSAPREESAEKALLASEFWMYISRLSRRDFNLETLEEVVSTYSNESVPQGDGT